MKARVTQRASLPSVTIVSVKPTPISLNSFSLAETSLSPNRNDFRRLEALIKQGHFKDTHKEENSLNFDQQTLLRRLNELNIPCQVNDSIKPKDLFEFRIEPRPIRMEFDSDCKSHRKSSCSFDPYLKYVLKQPLKQVGCFGQINLVLSRLDRQTELAMKKIDLTLLNDPRVKASNKAMEYERLVRCLKSLLAHSGKNFNLVRLIDTFASRDLKSAYIVMDYYGMNSLKERIAAHRANRTLVAETFVTKWFEEAITGLSYLHEHNMWHGNLKPSNFLLTSDERIKLSDFGYYELYDSADYFKKLVAISDRDGENYLPAETNQTYEYTQLSEVYCVGAVFYELITNERLHWKDEVAAVRLSSSQDNFAYLLMSMVDEKATRRPASKIIHEFNEWQHCLHIQQLLRHTGHSTTHACLWRTDNKRLMLKQIRLTKVRACLPDVLQLRLEPHLNVLPIYKYVLVNERLFVLNEHMPHGSLKNKIDCQSELETPQYFKEELVLKWLLQICNGLEYLHARRIVNGNLKCENILFDAADCLKLVDYGIHSNARTPATVQTDVYMLGECLFNTLTLRSYDSKELAVAGAGVQLKKSTSTANMNIGQNKLNLFGRAKSTNDLRFKFFGNEYSSRLIRNVIGMLHEAPSQRPTLKGVLASMNMLSTVIDSYRLMANYPLCYTVNGRMKDLLFRDSDRKDFVIVVSVGRHSSLPKLGQQLATTRLSEHWVSYCGELSRLNTKRRLQASKSLDYHEGSLGEMTDPKRMFTKRFDNDEEEASGRCLCVQLVEEALPAFVCTLEGGYMLGADADFIYLIDAACKIVKVVALLDALETTRTYNSRQNKLANFKQQQQHLRLNINIKVNAIYYEATSRQLLLLITVQNQHCFLNIFDLEFGTPSVEVFMIYLNRKFHLAPVKPESDVRLLCHEANVFVCERNVSLRVFDKETGNYLFRMHEDIFVEIKDNTRRLLLSDEDEDDDQTKKNDHHVEHHHPAAAVRTNNADSLVQDACIDLNGNMYLAFGRCIRAYNKHNQLLWSHVFDRSNSDGKPLKSGVEGRIDKIFVSNEGLLSIVTRDDKELFKTRFYMYT